MIIIDDQYLSEDIVEKHFACDLSKCKGACCVEGDEGAPIEEEEISELEDCIDDILPYMRPEGVEVIKEFGVFDYGSAGNFATPLVNNNECAFVYFENDIALCAIEKAWLDKKITFQKPISCHLYPIRITEYKNFEALNYHAWDICKPALKNGKEKNELLYINLKDSLCRKYGEEWYSKLLATNK